MPKKQQRQVKGPSIQASTSSCVHTGCDGLLGASAPSDQGLNRLIPFRADPSQRLLWKEAREATPTLETPKPCISEDSFTLGGLLHPPPLSWKSPGGPLAAGREQPTGCPLCLCRPLLPASGY